MTHKIRAGLALLLLVVLSATSLVAEAHQARLIRQQSLKVHQMGDDLTLWADRLEPLIPYLPQDGLIGYISERDIPGLDYSATDQSEEMAMSQYILTPRILIQGPDQLVVIGNITNLNPDQIPAVAAALGLEVDRSFSYGIYLFRKAGE